MSRWTTASLTFNDGQAIRLVRRVVVVVLGTIGRQAQVDRDRQFVFHMNRGFQLHHNVFRQFPHHTSDVADDVVVDPDIVPFVQIRRLPLVAATGPAFPPFQNGAVALAPDGFGDQGHVVADVGDDFLLEERKKEKEREERERKRRKRKKEKKENKYEQM